VRRAPQGAATATEADTKGCKKVSIQAISPHVRPALDGTDSRTGPFLRNAALAALSTEALLVLEPHLRQRFFEEGSVLWDCGEPVSRVYFPISGIISVVLPVRDGNGAEVANVGREGGAGMAYGLRQLRSPTRGTIQIGGNVAFLPAAQFAGAAAQNAEIAALAEFCRDWLMMQAQQAAACNAVHTAEQRFSRWLLQCCEHTESDVVPLTQEGLAQALGLRRTTVTLIAQGLQASGVLNYKRGRIMIRDPHGLRSVACDCCSALDQSHWPSSRLVAAGRSQITQGLAG
jgi:CRP-like cAMP-binding protein